MVSSSAIEFPLTRSCLGTGPLRIHERHFSELQHGRSARRDLSSQLSKMLRSYSTNQLESRAALAGKCFNLQGHGLFVSAKCAPFESVGISSPLRKNMLPYFQQLPTSRREIYDSVPPLRRAVKNSGSQLLSAGQLAKREI